MRKITINLSGKKKTGSLLPFAAAALLLFALALTWHSLSEYLRNRSQLNVLTDRAASIEKTLPEELRKNLSADRASLKEFRRDIEVINNYAYRKSFSWTGLLSSLEEALPGNVRLRQISPEFKSGKVRITGEARVMESALVTVDRLGKAGFKDVFLLKHSRDDKTGHIAFDISAVYRPL